MKPLFAALVVTLSLLLLSCGSSDPSQRSASEFQLIAPLAETEPVANAEDAADDPAIWINRQEPAKSRILGTNKKQGLLIYDLEGRELQLLDRGSLNNVDLRQNVTLGNKERDIAVATNRTYGSFDVFEIEETGYVQWLMEQPLPFEDPYGICMYQSQSGELYAFVNAKSGEYQQWLISAPRGPLKLTLVREFSLASQPEGCAADDLTGNLFLGEEQVGIWQMSADPSVSPQMEIVARVGDAQLVADIEGMDVYRSDTETGYLVVSSQGNFSYSLYELGFKQKLRGAFKVVENAQSGIDGAEKTDGLAVTHIALSDTYPEGLLVVQDGMNTLPEANQNFKLVSWRDIREKLKLN